MEEVGVEPSSGHFETQACPFRPNLSSNDGIYDGVFVKRSQIRIQTANKAIWAKKICRRAVVVWLRGQHRDRERPCREGVTRHEAPNNLRTAPLPQIDDNRTFEPCSGSPSTKVVIEANILLWYRNDMYPSCSCIARPFKDDERVQGETRYSE